MTIRRGALTSLLAFVFFFSGFASLIYQVVWQRILTLHYGVGAISITIIVSVYMFGLGFGALLGGYLAERCRNRIIPYFVVELLIGLFGLISLPFLQLLGQYTAGSDHMLSSLYIFIFLSVPTLLMGATLPILTKLFNQVIHDFLDTVSFLYFINTIGASVGAIFASYFLISFLGLDSALHFAVALNFILAGLIFLANYFRTSPAQHHHEPLQQNGFLGRTAYLLVFVTGFLAIGYEIVWFRAIGVLVKASPYAFSTVLSVYLLGIAFGSLFMNKWLRGQPNIDQRSLFFLLQFLIGVYIVVSFTTYYCLTKYTELGILTRHSFIHDLHPLLALPSFQSVGTALRGLFSLFDVFFWPVAFVFIPTTLMGASFPLISSLALSQEDKEGMTIGLVYFSNILGNVFGGIATGFIILPHLGTENTLVLFSSIGLILGLAVTIFSGRKLALKHKAPIILILLIATLIFFPKKGQLYQVMHSPPDPRFKAHIEEGIDAVVLAYYHQDNVRNYINGLHHGGRPGYEYYNKVIEAVSFAPKVENALIIGYGTGSFTEAILKLPELEKVTVVEISQTLIENLTKFPCFNTMLADRRLNLVIDDARRFLLRTADRYDVILMDPLRTTTSYSNNLYSQQFFYLLSKHLTNEGIILIYTDEMRTLPKTVLSIFDQVRLYRHRTNCFVIASNASLIHDPERKRTFFQRFSPSEREAISRCNATFLGDQSYIKQVAQQYPINRDLKPICEYYIGLQLKKRCFPKKYN